MKPLVGFFTPVSGEDASYCNQYLADIDRLGFPFTVYLDRCSNDLKNKLTSHPLCAGYVANDNKRREFSEKDRQQPMDMLMDRTLWAVSMDFDETWERDAKVKFECLRSHSNYTHAKVKTAHLWETPEFIRVDQHCRASHADRCYNLKFRHVFLSGVTNGPRTVVSKQENQAQRNFGYTYKDCMPEDRSIGFETGITCLHWGLMTRELRLMHKERWDRIYSHPDTGGGNPYGTWKKFLDEETYPPIVERHDLT
jgi:hypothetical protein